MQVGILGQSQWTITSIRFKTAQLLAASTASQSSEDWLVQGDAGKITFRPFAAIGEEPYRLYHKVVG